MVPWFSYCRESSSDADTSEFPKTKLNDERGSRNIREFETKPRAATTIALHNPIQVVRYRRASVSMAHVHCTLLLSLVVLILAFTANARWRSESDPYFIGYTRYYYSSLPEKMRESLSIGNCTLGRDLEAADYSIDDNVRQMYGNMRTKVAREGPIYFQSTPTLCTSEKFKLFQKGKYKRTKGCFNEAVLALPKSKRKYFQNFATLHPDHLRCDNKVAIEACMRVKFLSSEFMSLWTSQLFFNSYLIHLLSLLLSIEISNM